MHTVLDSSTNNMSYADTIINTFLRLFNKIKSKEENKEIDKEYSGINSDILTLISRNHKSKSLKNIIFEQKCSMGLNYQGEYYYEIRKFKEATDCFELSAEQNNSQGQFNLGFMLKRSLNYESAIIYFDKSARQGNLQSKNQIVKTYFNLPKEFSLDLTKIYSEDTIAKWIDDIKGVYKVCKEASNFYDSHMNKKKMVDLSERVKHMEKRNKEEVKALQDKYTEDVKKLQDEQLEKLKETYEELVIDHINSIIDSESEVLTDQYRLSLERKIVKFLGKYKQETTELKKDFEVFKKQIITEIRLLHEKSRETETIQLVHNMAIQERIETVSNENKGLREQIKDHEEKLKKVVKWSLIGIGVSICASVISIFRNRKK